MQESLKLEPMLSAGDLIGETKGIQGILYDKSVLAMLNDMRMTRENLFGEPLCEVNKTIQALGIFNEKSVLATMQSSLKEFQKAFEPYKEIRRNFESIDSWHKISNTVGMISKSLSNYETMGRLLETSSANAIFKDSTNFSKLIQTSLSAFESLGSIDFDIQHFGNPSSWAETDNILDVVNNICDDHYKDDSEEEGFKSNEEIFEAVEEQINNPENFLKRIKNWSERMKKEYAIAYHLLKFIVMICVIPYLEDTVGKPIAAKTVAFVRELPEQGKNLVAELREGIEAMIVDDVPYYYKVTFTDENGEEREGYVSKRSVKIIEEDEDKN